MQRRRMQIFGYLCIGMFILESFCLAQSLGEKTRFSVHPQSFRRYSTSPKDKESGMLLPQYKDLASNLEKGITWEEWSEHCLSRERFEKLDSDGDGLISREELNQDIFMGETQLHSQTSELIERFCKKEFPDYKIRLRKIKGIEEIEYVLNEQIYSKNKLPIRLLSEYPSVDPQIATKTYIQIKHGRYIQKQVDLGSYALLLLRDQRDEESLTLHLLGIALIILVASASIFIR